MRSHRHNRTIDRRGFLGSLTLVGAAVVAPGISAARESGPDAPIRLAQAASPASGAATAPVVKVAERVAGSAVNHAYAVKAGSWVFLNGHEAYDFEKGLAPEVEGSPGYPLSGRPPLRREADYILKRMRVISRNSART